MTCIADIAADYLATRRAMGYKLVEDGRLLTHLVAFLEAEGAEHLTVSDALAWAEQPPGAARVWWAAKLRVVRGFARYLLAFDPATEVPPARLLREPSHRVVPHIYSDEEVRRLMAAAGRLANDHRADTYRTVVGLLAVSGMRVGEVARLDQEDVDLDQGLLTVRGSKFGKSRQLPVHATTVEALAGYASRRDRRRPVPKSPSFFTSSTGTRLLRDNMSTVGPLLVRDAGLVGSGGRPTPRLHDLRHTFAVRCLVGWYRAGLDVEQRLPVLSTYLGHVAPSTTYWYLTAVPELLEIVAERLDGLWEAGR